MSLFLSVSNALETYKKYIYLNILTFLISFVIFLVYFAKFCLLIVAIIFFLILLTGKRISQYWTVTSSFRMWYDCGQCYEEGDFVNVWSLRMSVTCRLWNQFQQEFCLSIWKGKQNSTRCTESWEKQTCLEGNVKMNLN